MFCLLVSFNQAAPLSVPDEERVPVILPVPCAFTACMLHVHIFLPLLVHITHASFTHTGTRRNTQSHPYRKPTGNPHALARRQSVGFLLSMCAVAHLASVMFSILKCWCGGLLLVAGVGALSQGCACGPNPLINSASTGHRWQVGTETGCTPPLSFCRCQTLRSP